MERYTIHQFNEDFPDERACLDLLAGLIYEEWPEGLPCRACGVVRKHHALTSRPKAYSCAHCGTHVYPLAGTIFEKSRTPLKSWFYAMYLMAQTRMGISAKQLERELGVTYKTAWRMFKQIRALMAEDGGPLTGVVEVDETYYGGKPRYRNGAARPRDESGRIKRGPRPSTAKDAKRPIVGAVARGGRVHAKAIPNRSGREILPLVAAHIPAGTVVYTDEAPVYRTLTKRGYQHSRIRHQAKVYVDGDVHTNTIEGFWSLLKNGIRGAHRAVGADYLQDYVNEYTFRYNHRDDETPMFRTITGRMREVRAGKLGSYAPLGSSRA